MELKIDVSMPTKSARTADNCEDIIRHGYSFADAYIETLESKIIISGLPNPCDGTKAKIHLGYFEVYKSETSLGDFFVRAEKFARDYCAAIGIGAVEASDAQSGTTYSGLMAINVSKPNQISIFDGDGKLRCVLGPLDVKQNQVLINDANIESAKISNVIITNAKALDAQDVALRNSIREIVKELLASEGEPGGAIWRAIKNF